MTRSVIGGGFALAVIFLTACDSSKQAQKLAEDEANFKQVSQGEQDRLQWKLDKATAESIFYRHYSDAPDEPTPAYFTYIHCHEEPPTHDANKKVCAALQARVAKTEAKAQAKAAREKAAW